MWDTSCTANLILIYLFCSLCFLSRSADPHLLHTYQHFACHPGIHGMHIARSQVMEPEQHADGLAITNSATFSFSEILTSTMCCSQILSLVRSWLIFSCSMSWGKYVSLHLICLPRSAGGTCCRIGVAYYDVDTRQMFVLETWEDGSEQFPSVQLSKYCTCFQNFLQLSTSLKPVQGIYLELAVLNLLLKILLLLNHLVPTVSLVNSQVSGEAWHHLHKHKDGRYFFGRPQTQR